MTSDADDALSWEGDEDRPRTPDGKRPEGASAPERTLPRGWKAVGRDSGAVDNGTLDSGSAERVGHGGALPDPRRPQPLSTPMLVLVGVIGGIYLLYTVGWIIGGFNLQGSALFLVPAVMYQAAVWAAVLAPALWFIAVWLLTRRSASWIRVIGFIAGAALLVPWPFVMTGAAGA